MPTPGDNAQERSAAFSLYLHIPYCQSKCPYCDFNSHAAAQWPEDEYVAALLGELERRADEAPWAGRRLKTIFFGGGTPSLFQPESIAHVLDAAVRRFGLEHEAEITLEANPGTVDMARLAGFRAAGVNRVSFGAQSFNDERLRFLGRIHTAAETREAARMARRAGFARFNLDLIFAVPGQTVEETLDDIGEAAALGPDHISAYNLTFEEGTAFFTEMKRGRIRPLDGDRQAEFYAAVRTELPRRGYAMYEISNYAPPGHEARHNLTYWRMDSYLGLGAGAHSFARDERGGGGRRWWNERMPARYILRALADGCAQAGDEPIDARRARGEFVFLNLRLRAGLSLADFAGRFGESFESAFGERAARLFEGGLLVREDGRIYLSDRGLELADSVFAEFI
ncbi:MAG TPA: radical SAM family heme chaperone HemW [Candidatus Binataceae bacterium]|nr:radical SAM family heme chaperone HemW [Candidatus Binataceae bacterium]